jgi:membrane-associated protease RseP (regulator of RpoE activity)
MSYKLKVARVEKNSQALKLGIEPNDYILSAYNMPTNSYSEFTKAISLAENSEIKTYKIVVMRNNNELVFEATPGKLGLEFSEVHLDQATIDNSTSVVVRDFSVPFSSLVVFFIKCMFAAIPATLIAFGLIFMVEKFIQ